MEFATIKRNRNRKKKKKRHVKKRRCDQPKFEVKSFKRRKIVADRTFFTKEKLAASTMEAESFWKNYTVAHEWQKRHSVTWWRSRCFALEYENQILRDKIRSLADANNVQSNFRVHEAEYHENEREDYSEEDEDSDNENLEFHVDEDMMTFLEQSIRHKIELKKKKELESAERENEENLPVMGGAAWVEVRNANAKLLYGESSSTILAMETALQTSVDRHKDIAKPQLWPIISLRP